MLSSRVTMEVYFGLGSNLGDRRAHLDAGIRALVDSGMRTVGVSPIVETPALLPKGAPPEWNVPYLNLAVKGEVSGDPVTWRTRLKAIEDRLGRTRESRWAPRPLDIDILLWGDELFCAGGMTIPHVELTKRNFVITPLLHLAPNLPVPGSSKTVFALSQKVPPLPLWMGIINLTPDSFSDGGRHADSSFLYDELLTMIDAGVHILDLGAESTGPSAHPISAAEEWQRLAPGLEAAVAACKAVVLPPRISVDTRHAEVAAKALEHGADLINDVSGLESPAMRAVARAAHCEWIIMHHLGLPTRKERTLVRDDDPVTVVLQWLQARCAQIEADGITLERLIVDPGIGFGKDSLQSLTLLQRISELRQASGLRVLVGHSRKSFMQFAPCRL